MVEFSPVTNTDLTAILGIYNYYTLNSTATFHSGIMSQKDLEEFLFVAVPKYPSFLIKDNNEIIGYCFLTQYKKRQAYDRSAELSIYLKPEFTGKGIGTLALDHLEAAAKKAGIRVLVGTLCGENHASIRLMEKSGYSRCAHLKNIGEKFGKILDVVVYQKEI
ncbi:N-acetyltransferase family protein [uncultured Methanoregula sp.]|uniref:GNAT family N-acetyltransferase n=1 Tax=uncultured Methanoregula sp. TaxID=1005933 RepID=UPI002AAB4B75|nr:N-acetyltransferase family protein [uncultured Methanoregula sp.]